MLSQGLGTASRRGHQRCILASQVLLSGATEQCRAQPQKHTPVTALPVMDELSRIHLLPTAVLALQSSQERAAHCHVTERASRAQLKSASAELEGAALTLMFSYKTGYAKGR